MAFKDTRPLSSGTLSLRSALLKSTGFTQPSASEVFGSHQQWFSLQLSVLLYSTGLPGQHPQLLIQLHWPLWKYMGNTQFHNTSISAPSCLVASPAHFQSSSTYINAISSLWNLHNLQRGARKTVKNFGTHELHQKQSSNDVIITAFLYAQQTHFAHQYLLYHWLLFKRLSSTASPHCP